MIFKCFYDKRVLGWEYSLVSLCKALSSLPNTENKLISRKIKIYFYFQNLGFLFLGKQKEQRGRDESQEDRYKPNNTEIEKEVLVCFKL